MREVMPTSFAFSGIGHTETDEPTLTANRARYCRFHRCDSARRRLAAGFSLGLQNIHRSHRHPRRLRTRASDPPPDAAGFASGLFAS
jgi:hypothetical protein